MSEAIFGHFKILQDEVRTFASNIREITLQRW